MSQLMIDAVFGMPFHEKKILYNSPNFTTFLATIGASPLIFVNLNPLYTNKSEFSSTMDASNQIWLKIAEW